MEGGTVGSRKSDIDWSMPWESLRLQHRLILFAKFVHLYEQNVCAAILLLTLALRHSERTIDAEHAVLDFMLKYRVNNKGNPTKMFVFVDARVVPVADDGVEGSTN